MSKRHTRYPSLTKERSFPVYFSIMQFYNMVRTKVYKPGVIRKARFGRLVMGGGSIRENRADCMVYIH